MTCTVSATETGCVRVAGELCILHAAELKPQLIEALAGEGELEMDLAQVSEIDTAGLQLLLLARREVGRAGRQLRFVNLSESVREALELAGITSDFVDQLSALRSPAAKELP